MKSLNVSKLILLIKWDYSFILVDLRCIFDDIKVVDDKVYVGEI